MVSKNERKMMKKLIDRVKDAEKENPSDDKHADELKKLNFDGEKFRRLVNNEPLEKEDSTILTVIFNGARLMENVIQMPFTCALGYKGEWVDANTFIRYFQIKTPHMFTRQGTIGEMLFLALNFDIHPCTDYHHINHKHRLIYHAFENCYNKVFQNIKKTLGFELIDKFANVWKRKEFNPRPF